MHLHSHDTPADARTQGRIDKCRVLRALNVSLAIVLLLAIVFAAQHAFDLRDWAVTPHTLQGLIGLLTAPLLHGSFEHITANAAALILLGTLAGSVCPQATVRALPLLWLGSGLGAWLLGAAGTHHLGASGVTHGLMFLVFVLGLLRRDRPAIAAAMIAFMLYGGMLLTVLPREPGVSWQAHLGGALAGAIAAFLFRHSDPPLPRRKYSWEVEEELAEEAARVEREQFEPERPRDVPVLWQRQQGERGVVLRFPPRKE